MKFVLYYLFRFLVELVPLEFEVQENSKITEQELRNLDFPKSAIIGGVIRDGKGFLILFYFF
mgnify:CR=1 FL=1